MDQGLQTLLDLGFEESGQWILSQSMIRYSLSRHATESNVLYAFVSQEQVLYIGKTAKTLNQRMSGYKTPGRSQRTNFANSKLIRQMLLQGERVQIFVLVPQETVHYRGILVNLAAGLEDALIAQLHPMWNQTGGTITRHRAATSDN